MTVLHRRYGDANQSPDVFDIPGVGTMRAYYLLKTGVDDVGELASMRPAEMASVPNISEDIATVVIEGVRELARATEPVLDRLTRQTGADREELSKALSMLAVSGVPGSGADTTLRELYGPPITEMGDVDGRMVLSL